MADAALGIKASAWRRVLSRQNAPLTAHYGVLVLAFVVFAIVASRSWFFYDDWYFLKNTPGILWAPHVGHFNLIPVLVFRAIQYLFGMDHYLPFAVPAILAHLGVVHLLWRFTLRAGVRPWVATAFSVLLAFLGAGAEALDWAVQIGFVGAITGMLGCILLLDGGGDAAPKLSVRRGVGASILVLLSLATSGVAVPFIVVAVILCVIRSGVVRTLAVFAIPGVVYICWYLLEGRTAPADGRASGLAQILAVPQYAVTMLSDGLGRMMPIAVLGSLTFVALGVWWMFTVRSGLSTARVPYLLFLAAPLFALLTGYSRIGTGLETATSSRYVYVVAVAITPLMALGLDRLTRRLAPGASVMPVVAIVLIVAMWNMGGVAVALGERIHRVDSTRAQLAETAAIIGQHPGCLADTDRPSPQWAPDVTVGDLRTWIERGWYHPSSGSPAAAAPQACS